MSARLLKSYASKAREKKNQNDEYRKHCSSLVKIAQFSGKPTVEDIPKITDQHWKIEMHARTHYFAWKTTWRPIR